MSARLEAYVALERVMLELDAANDSLADRIRDLTIESAFAAKVQGAFDEILEGVSARPPEA